MASVLRPGPPVEAVQRVELSGLAGSTSSSLSVTHGGPQCCCELRLAELPILAGVWSWHLEVSGQELHSDARWSNECYEINEDAAYVELRLQLPGGYSIERQVFLARRDGFAFLADAVEGPGAATGHYRMQLPLAPEMRWQPADPTQEGDLFRGRKGIARVLPLSLPEWQNQSGGRITAADGQLVMTLPWQGQRLHSALFLDLDARRRRRPLTWRRLTVGESLQVAPRDVAVAYRVQLGASQWLIYRSLGPAANRSVLGLNLLTEFAIARFHKNGTTEKLLEIE